MTEPVRTATVTKIATAADVRELGVLLARQNGRAYRAIERVEQKLAVVEEKLDRLLAILQALSADQTTKRTTR